MEVPATVCCFCIVPLQTLSTVRGQSGSESSAQLTRSLAQSQITARYQLERLHPDHVQLVRDSEDEHIQDSCNSVVSRGVLDSCYVH